MTGKIIIAVDGFSASGKGTISKGLAKYFRFAHLDTGLLYRGVGFLAHQQDPTLSNNDIAINIAKNFNADCLNYPELRNDTSSQLASKVATIPQVREALLDFQRNFAIAPPADGSVLDGRDIGTVICPLAPVKLFITASAFVRAQRRHKELEGMLGEKVNFDKVLHDLQERDARDANRSVAPLKAAADAVTLDTTQMSVNDAILQAIKLTQAVMHDKNRQFSCI
ncbi:MAG: cytidylate kinase [Alphaproteobacteria bacterium]|jgi:cytidylate kinase